MYQQRPDVDAWFPGMVFAAVQRGPAGTRLARWSKDVCGALAVVPVSGVERFRQGAPDSVAVVAANTWQAIQLLEQSGARWEATSAQEPVWADKIETLSCSVHCTGTSVEIWAPVRAADWLVSIAVEITGLPVSGIHVNTPFLTAGLPRQVERDCVAQALQVGMAVPCRPVKVIWLQEAMEHKVPSRGSSVHLSGTVPFGAPGGTGLRPRLFAPASTGRLQCC